MGESTLQHATALKSLVTTGILIVRGKWFIKNVDLIKIELTWTTTRQKKKNVYFGKQFPKIKKHTFPLMTTFYDLALKIEITGAKKDVKPSLKT